MDKFNGKVDQMSYWLTTNDTIAAALEREMVEMVKRFPLHLTGFARKTYELLTDEQKRGDWNDLVATFKTKLTIRDSVQEDMRAFMTRVQRPKEGVTEFACNLLKLVG